MIAAAAQPNAQNDSSSTTRRPRCLAGANSLTREAATGNSPPSPNPTRKRISTRDASPCAKAHRPVETLKINRVIWKIAFRPKRSARLPATAPPRNIPASPALVATAI